MKPDAFRPLFTPAFVAEALGMPHHPAAVLAQATRTSGKPDFHFSSIVTDSRKIQSGCLFIAIQGEKMDGHEFIRDAVAKGALGIICRKDYPVQSSANLSVFAVEDTVKAFRRLSAVWRKKFSIPVIAVAGSVGKTTTKELLAAILHGKWKNVLKTQGSQNGFVGIPMTVLELRPEHGAAVIEVGIDEIGTMEQHISILHPTASLLTAIGPEHLEKLGDVPTVAREEGIALSLTARENGIVAINLDDPWIRPYASSLRDGRKFAFTVKGSALPSQARGFGENSVLTGKLSDDGTSLTLSGFGLKSLTIEMPLLGSHNASNLMAAVCMALALGLTGEEIQAGLKTFRGADGRSEIRELPSRITALCDYYNANPSSVEAGLELLTQLAKNDGRSGIRWACLADMLELGPDEERFHRELADKITELGIENVLLHGSRMKWLHAELQARKFAGALAHYESKSELSAALEPQPGATLLIKGSRSMKMEEVWKLLTSRIESG